MRWYTVQQYIHPVNTGSAVIYWHIGTQGQERECASVTMYSSSGVQYPEKHPPTHLHKQTSIRVFDTDHTSCQTCGLLGPKTCCL